ncbi:glycosyltransferase [Pseudonocardia spinosispora]|uniref:glycosyltransferase n=1 Tax=Pseudonocardia spinosispora TaxID=103441 RepID=UPI00041AED46|nr:glycosyltransferase [Pseudonocardia spinosispora]
MRVLLLAVGSQGDVRPLVALAERLQRDGHEPTVAAPPLFRPLAIAAGVPFAALDVGMMALAATMSDSHGPLHFARLARSLGGLAGEAITSAWAVARNSGADVVVHHPVLPLGQHLAERLGVPAVIATPLPALTPTALFAAPVWSNTVRLPASVNRASYRMASLQAGLWARGAIDRWRSTSPELPRRPGRHDPTRCPSDSATVPVLHGFSPRVLPRPADWPDTAHVTGYWNLATRANWTPPRKLAAFLDDGEPPVYIGFGSMPIREPGGLGALVERTMSRLGRRAIVASGYHGLRGMASTDDMLMLRHVPHDWLFPRVAAVVHHGGAGTTGAAASAGRPQVICPVGTDQPFWADRMHGLGVSARAPRLRSLTGPSLERALSEVLEDEELRRRARKLGRHLRAEDGTGRAVRLLTQIVARPDRKESPQP